MPLAGTATWNSSLQLLLLGELEVRRSEGPCALPASRKSRALLGYLAARPGRHLRSELCDLFWEDADDPRAALRWCLTQIRRVLGERDRAALRADRDSVEFGAQSVATDLSRVAKLGRDELASTPTQTLAQAAALFRGEFLNGLELPGCYRFHEWCLAEREAASRLHERILCALVARPGSDPAQALVHARALVARNPLNEHGHIEVMRLLGALGRKGDALAQYEQCCRIFERELAIAPSAALEAARRELGGPSVTIGIARAERNVPSSASFAAPDAAPGEPKAASTVAGDASDASPAAHPSRIATAASGREHSELFGRATEVAQLRKVVDTIRAARESDVVLISGVPGIGKSRLLDEIAGHTNAAGGRVVRGRAFEAEMIRPFGFWIDALRGLRPGELPGPLQAELLPLIRGDAENRVATQRDRLFDLIVSALSHLAQDRPVAVLVDDLQWIEEASAALLHFAIRSLAGNAVLFTMAARTGELEDNVWAQRLLSERAQAGRIQRVALGALGDDEAKALVRRVAPGIGIDAIVAQAAGNPLYLIELARARGSTEPGTQGLLEGILETRLSRLSQGAGELLHWAAAFGRGFPLDALVDACGMAPARAITLLAELERYDLVHGDGETDYAFSHDLIQQAAYARASQPMRRLMHKSIAVLLGTRMAARPEIAGEVLRHAGLGEQRELAVRAAVCAGDRGLRIFANREAAEFARQGLRHAAHIADKAVRVTLQIALLRIQVLAASATGLDRHRPPAGVVQGAIDEARALRLYADAAQGYYLLSVIHQESGDLAAARHATLSAAEAIQTSDHLTRASQLANTARCLVELGRDIPRARELVAEAKTLAQASGVNAIEVRWCNGLLSLWDGDLDAAAHDIEQAIDLADRAEDRWRQCKCIAWLATIELERGRPAQAIARAREMKRVAGNLGEGSDEPLAQAIEVLALQMLGDDAADLDAAIAALRAADDKSRLAYVLNVAASIQLERGRFETAASLATDALSTAEAIGDENESALARVTLEQAVAAHRDGQRAARQLAGPASR